MQAPHARGNLSILLNAICVACKFVDSAVRKVRDVLANRPMCTTACLSPVIQAQASCTAVRHGAHWGSLPLSACKCAVQAVPSLMMFAVHAGGPLGPAWSCWYREHPGGPLLTYVQLKLSNAPSTAALLAPLQRTEL